jgi:hypothetical protein
MGYASDLGTGTAHDICPVTGYPRDRWGHLLQTASLNDGSVLPDWQKTGTELPNFTSPYGHLLFAVGSGDDFYCFDYAGVNAGPFGNFMVLHATINSESGGFIQDAFNGYEVMPCNTMAEQKLVIRKAFGMVDAALEWCHHNGIKHDVRGWCQNPYFFAITVAEDLFGYKFKKKNGQTLSLRKNNRAAHRIASDIAFT